jgi:hypothetical protein
MDLHVVFSGYSPILLLYYSHVAKEALMTGNNASSKTSAKTSAVRMYGEPGLLTKGWDKDNNDWAERQRQQAAYREEAKAEGTFGKPTPPAGKGVSH